MRKICENKMKRKRCVDALDLPDVISPACDDYETLPRTLCELSRVLNLDLIKDVQSIICGYLADVVFLQSSLCETDPPVLVFRPFLITHAQVFRDVYDLSGESVYRLDFSTDVIRLFVMYVESHKLHIPPRVTSPLVSKRLEDHTNCKFDVWFADLCDAKKDQLARVTGLGNFWNVSVLVHLLCAKFAIKIRGVPLNEFKTALTELSVVTDESVPYCKCKFH
jgi:hypothetical protein